MDACTALTVAVPRCGQRGLVSKRVGSAAACRHDAGGRSRRQRALALRTDLRGSSRLAAACGLLQLRQRNPITGCAHCSDSSQPRRERMLNVPAVVVALLVVLGLVHAFLVLVLTPEQTTEFLLLFAFIPARYDASAARRGLAGRLRRRYLDLRHLCADPRRSQSSGLQCRMAAGLRLAGRATIWSAAFLAFMAVDCRRRRRRASRHPFRRIAADDRRLGVDLRSDGGGDAVCIPARRSARGVAGPRRTLIGCRPRRCRRACAIRACWHSCWYGSASTSVRRGPIGIPGVEQAVAWQAHIGGFLAGLFGFAAFDPIPLAPPARPARRRTVSSWDTTPDS